MAERSVDGIAVEIRGDYRKLTEDMDNARTEVRAAAEGMSNALNNALSPRQLENSIMPLVHNLKKVKSAASLAGDEFDHIGVELKELRQQVGMSEQSFQRLQSRMLKTKVENTSSRAIRSIARSADLGVLSTAKLQRELGDTTGAFQTLRQGGVSSLNTIRERVFSLQSAFVALGVGMAGKKALDEFAEFDKGLIGVSKTTNMVGAELESFGRTIQDLSLDLATPDEELLAIAQSAGQLGVKGSKNLLAFSKTVAQLGMSSNLAGEEAATALARILNVTGESVSGVETLGSVIVALGNDMAANESEIAKMGTEVAQATAEFKTSSAEATALGAALRSVGVRAELGGSAVGRAFRAIDASIREGGESLRALEQLTGIASGQIAQRFDQDSVGVFQLFVEGLGRVVKSGGSAASVLEQFGLKGEEIMKVLPVLALRSELVGKSLGIAGDETENATALMKEAIAAQKSFSAQMRLGMNAIDLVASDIGEALAPAIVDVAKEFRGWVKENREFLKQDVAGHVRGIGQAAAELAKSIGGIGVAIQNLPDGSLGILMAAMGGGMAFGPAGGVVAGTGAYLLQDQDTRAMLGMGNPSNEKIEQSIGIKEGLLESYLKWDTPPKEEIDTLNREIAVLKRMLKLSQSQDPRNRSRGTGIIYSPTSVPSPGSDNDNNDTPPPPGSGEPDKPEYLPGAYDSDLKNMQRLAQKRRDALDAVSADYRKLTMGDTEFAIEETRRRYDELRKMAQGDSETLREIKAVEQAEIAEIHEDAANKARMAWEEYALAAQDRVANTEAMIASFGGTIEDSLTTAFTEGKFAAEDFFKTIYAEVIRMQVARPLAGAVTGGLGGAIEAIFHHDGGVVGSGGRPGSVPATAFIGAPRYHSGGVAGLKPDEVPAILQRGEIVLSREQVAGATTATGGSAPRITFNLINESGEPMSADPPDMRFDGEQWVATMVMRGTRNNTAGLRDFFRAGGAN